MAPVQPPVSLERAVLWKGWKPDDMAHYFRYKSADELIADAQRLGQSLALSDRYDVLFAPLEIGGRRCGSRLAVQPMEGCDGTLDGRPDELTYRRYVRFGSGGAKLIWGEATAISDDGRMNPRQLWLHDGSAAEIENMLAGCRRAHREACGDDGDLLVGLQLTHSGRYGYRGPLLATHDPLLDPLTRDKRRGRALDASYPLLGDDDLKRIEDQYLSAARLAHAVGCDFVDIKQCHRYLLSELLAARNRPGPYGGSLENRTRLVRQVIGRIREEIPDLIIATRFNAYDGIPYVRSEPDGAGRPCRHAIPLECAFGTDASDHTREDLVEPVQLARWLCDWGVALLNVTAGNPYANPHVVRPADYPPIDGYEAPEHPLSGVLRHFRLAAAIQAAVPDVPVVGSGYSWLQDFSMSAAAANVEANSVSLVGLGRGTLAQPDFATRLKVDGALDRKRTCRTFSYCTNLMRAKDHPLGQYPTGCPPFDKEAYGPIWKELQLKREA
jgi:2,4-dienoyl-CoA reductase-like NADH-dependent reductase (Old Yellow Enzyme family)